MSNSGSPINRSASATPKRRTMASLPQRPRRPTPSPIRRMRANNNVKLLNILENPTVSQIRRARVKMNTLYIPQSPSNVKKSILNYVSRPNLNSKLNEILGKKISKKSKISQMYKLLTKEELLNIPL